LGWTITGSTDIDANPFKLVHKERTVFAFEKNLELDVHLAEEAKVMNDQ
jgi:hypothetical protein